MDFEADLQPQLTGYIDPSVLLHAPLMSFCALGSSPGSHKATTALTCLMECCRLTSSLAVSYSRCVLLSLCLTLVVSHSRCVTVAHCVSLSLCHCGSLCLTLAVSYSRCVSLSLCLTLAVSHSRCVTVAHCVSLWVAGRRRVRQQLWSFGR